MKFEFRIEGVYFLRANLPELWDVKIWLNFKLNVKRSALKLI